MSHIEYSPTDLLRVNPEFVGIAHKYSAAKKDRVTLENERNQLHNKLMFKQSVDHKLEMSLDDKKSELRSAKKKNSQTRDSAEKKRQMMVQKEMELRELNRTVQANRAETRQNIREARWQSERKNKSSKISVSRKCNQLREKLRSTQMSRLQENRMRFKEVKMGEREGMQTVNEFYRQRWYKQMMTDEKRKSQEYRQQISRLNQSIDLYNDRIEDKKKNIYGCMNEISIYTKEPVTHQSKCLPSYLRDTLSASSSLRSSRPSDLLLNGVKNGQPVVFSTELAKS